MLRPPQPRIAAAVAAAHLPLRPTTPASFLSTAPKTKKKKKVPPGAAAGRIAFADGRWKKKAAAAPRLCAGCGVELVSDVGEGRSTSRLVAGDAARRAERSPRQERKARYADVTESSALCGRCKALQKGDVWRAYDSLRDVDSKVFSAQLSHIVGRRKFGMCLVVIDATDEFSSVGNLRDMVRSTPCLLAINKVRGGREGHDRKRQSALPEMRATPTSVVESATFSSY